MNSFFLTGSLCGVIAIWLLASCTAGFWIQRVEPVLLDRAIAWLLLIASTAAVEEICSNESGVVRMVAIIGALFLGMKIVVGV